MRKCKPDDHIAGILSHNCEHLVCEKCLECFDMDLSKWNASTGKGPIMIIERGSWPLTAKATEKK